MGRSDTGPSGRSLTAMASDTVRKRIVLFGGQGEDGGDIGDTWEWDGNQWTQQDVVGPTARSAHAMAFDPQRGRTVLFGGQIGARPETWEWDGSKWLQVAHIGPEARNLLAMAFNGRSILLFGGQAQLVALHRDFDRLKRCSN